MHICRARDMPFAVLVNKATTKSTKNTLGSVPSLPSNGQLEHVSVCGLGMGQNPKQTRKKKTIAGISDSSSPK